MRIRKDGFTLVELLVVIAIIGVLIGLLLPAVQAAREAARRSSCTNKVKQLALAFLNYENSRKEFPKYQYNNDPSWNSWRGHGVWTQMLPFIEEQALYDQFDFAQAFDAGRNFGSGQPGRARIDGFQCPSDSPFPDSNWGGTNYAVSGGATKNLYSGSAATTASGALLRWFPTTVAELTDGLSKTVLIAEFLHGDNNGGALNLERDFTNGLSLATANFPTAAEIETAGQACDGTAAGYQQVNAGKHWNAGLPGQCVINTVAPPNWAHVNCAEGGGFGYAADRQGIFPARSMHPGGVSTAACDGSTHFVNDNIELVTWQRLGARGDGQAANW
jgi:prepilin-type N-terminal cleavage/methylation domain-containing protein